MSRFYSDLPRGEKYEYKHLEKIKQFFPDMAKIQGKEKKWDLYSDSSKLGFEVKYDPKSQETGNIVVEIEMPPGNPSGLSTTRAKYWIFDTGKEEFYVRTDTLKDLVISFPTRQFTGPEDREPKIAYLIKKRFIKDISTTLTEIAFTEKLIELDPIEKIKNKEQINYE